MFAVSRRYQGASSVVSRALAPERLRTLVRLVQGNGLLAAVVLMFLFFSIASPSFFDKGNILTILVSVSVVGIVAIPGAMLILSGYVDFSVGSTAVLTAILFGELVAVADVPVLPAAAIVLGIGAVWGLVAGFLICRLEFSAIVVTLGGFAGLRGMAELISRGQTEFGFGAAFGELGNGRVLTVPVPVWVLLLFLLIGFYLWYRAPLGRHMTSIGADPVAAHSLGIKVKQIPHMLYVASGLMAALGGLILVSQLDASSLSIGEGLEIEVLTAILLGGVAFSGGRGSLTGVLWGVLFIGILTNGLVVMNISPFITGVAVGGALIFAAAMDVLYKRLDYIVMRRSELVEEDQAPSAAAPPAGQAPAVATGSGKGEDR